MKTSFDKNDVATIKAKQNSKIRVDQDQLMTKID